MRKDLHGLLDLAKIFVVINYDIVHDARDFAWLFFKYDPLFLYFFFDSTSHMRGLFFGVFLWRNAVVR